MVDPFLIPHIIPKARRVCANPLCAKPLSLLNKEDLCFSCHDQAMFRHSLLTSYRSSTPKLLR